MECPQEAEGSVVVISYADANRTLLQRSTAHMNDQLAALKDQLVLTKKLAKLLDAAAKQTSEPNLTLRDAFGRGLITFAMVEAA